MAKFMILTDEQILAAFKWSEGRELETKRGTRILRRAAPTPETLKFWNENKPHLSAAGVTYGHKWKSTTEFEFCWWKELSHDVLAGRAKNLELSRATDAEIAIPVNDGCEFLPYQKAGISFALNNFGDL